MFGFLKDKLKTWFGASKKDIEEKAEKKESEEKIKEKPKTKEKSIKERAAEAKQKEKADKEEKIKAEKRLEKEKKVKKKAEIKKERKITKKLIADIKKEGHQIESPEEQAEKFVSDLEKTKEIEEQPQVSEEIEEEIEIEEKEEEVKKPEEKKLGFFERLKKVFSYSLTQDRFEEIFSELEMLLLESNVALEVVEKVKDDLQKKLVGKELKKEKIELEIKESLRDALNDILIDPQDTIEEIKEYKKIAKEPYIMLFFGINGAGKTTSIAKLTDLCLKNKLSCVIAAADTFRAASIEQISIHAERLGVKVIKQDYGSDPSAVAFDAIKYAKSNKIDVVLVDTAGRMHTKDNLLQEMQKICRITKPNLKIFVAEAVAGNDATEQARAFNEMIGIDGSILSKVDVDEKGGTIISISYVTKKPILYLGVGQEYKDLELFNKKKFLERLGL